MKKANDDNEGSLGVLRVGSRRAPNMALHQHNARTMYKRNDTGNYMSSILDKEDLKYLRKKARQLDSSHIESKRRQAQAQGDREVVEGKRVKDRAREVKKRKVNDTLDLIKCRLDVVLIKETPGTNAQLDMELAWFRRIDSEVPIKARLGTKPVKIEALCAAVDRYNAGLTHDVEDDEETGNESGSDSDVDSDADMELQY